MKFSASALEKYVKVKCKLSKSAIILFSLRIPIV